MKTVPLTLTSEPLVVSPPSKPRGRLENDYWRDDNVMVTFHPTSLFRIEDVKLVPDHDDLDITSVQSGNCILTAFAKHHPLCDGSRGNVVRVFVRNRGDVPLGTTVVVRGTALEDPEMDTLRARAEHAAGTP